MAVAAGSQYCGDCKKAVCDNTGSTSEQELERDLSEQVGVMLSEQVGIMLLEQVGVMPGVMSAVTLLACLTELRALGQNGVSFLPW